VPHNLFEIEITESFQIEKNSNIRDMLNKIREYGVLIAIDDFGTGYSSLYYLKNIPIDRIKIAKELIDNIESDIYSYAIVKMVITIAKRQNIKVIAEGVEKKEQLDKLIELECDEIQGYYFAKPVDEKEFERRFL
jgi:EAL domain-containing protein (putative c-di-GMP-specific phosphodiesterase class I)